MNRRVIFHDCPILHGKSLARCATIQSGGGLGVGFPATTSKGIYHGMLSPPPGPLRFRRECEDRQTADDSMQERGHRARICGDVWANPNQLTAAGAHTNPEWLIF